MTVMPLEEKLKKILAFAEQAKSLGFTNTALIRGQDLEVDERVRFKCTLNTCGQYNNSWQCPPHTGSLTDAAKMLKRYYFALVVQLSRQVPGGNYEEVFRAEKNNFNDLIITLEKNAFKTGFPFAAGLSAGHCVVCPVCALKENKTACVSPHRARPSMEALGLDVGRICSLLNLPAGFIAGEVTLTGMLLID